MVPVRITNDGSMGAEHGTKVEIGGVEVPELVDVTLRHRVRNLPMVYLEVAAVDGFEVELPAEVALTVVAYPGYRVEASEKVDGKRTYKAVPYRESRLLSARFWRGSCGALLCDRAVEGLTTELDAENARCYGGRWMVGESMSDSAAQRIAAALGGEWVEEPTKQEEER